MALKCDGDVGYPIDTPVTFAPNKVSHNVSHDPLNPV